MLYLQTFKIVLGTGPVTVVLNSPSTHIGPTLNSSIKKHNVKSSWPHSNWRDVWTP